MRESSLARLFARHGAVLAIALKDGDATEALKPESPAVTTEASWTYLLGPEERPLVVFPILPPEIQAILPNAGTMHEAIPVEGEAQ